jgi:hypothetical protein
MVVVAIDAAGPDPIVVTEVTGRLERRSGDAWTPVASGAVLASDEVVRTGATATATIAISEHVQVKLGGARASELQLGAPIKLADGQLTADVKPGGAGAFGAAFGASDAVVETFDGVFSAVTDGDGGVTVVSSRGVARLRANGRAVELPANTQSIVVKADGPSAPTAIPTSLFLKVRAGARGGNAVISGKTSPGAMVSIDGVAIGVAADGTFSRQVPETRGPFRIEADDASGRHASETVTAARDGPAGRVTGKVTF